MFCSIPLSTSRELTDLITRTLKRNPKERIDYADFFNHPFLKKSNSISTEFSFVDLLFLLAQPVNIALASNMTIISSSPLREGILSAGQDLVDRFRCHPFFEKIIFDYLSSGFIFTTIQSSN